MYFRQYYGVPTDAKYGETFMSRFPILFQHRSLSMRETCMCWGIECPMGWYHILEQLCNYLEFQNIEFTKNYGIAIIADQVKEKYGTLRFYYHIAHVHPNGSINNEYEEDGGSETEAKKDIAIEHLSNLVDDIIEQAEGLTENTCADCGLPLNDDNSVETKGWIAYICKECDEKRQKKREELLKEHQKKIEKPKDDSTYNQKSID